MPQEITRAKLLERIRTARADLEAAIGGLSETQLSSPGFNGEWSLKDLIAHFTFWEQQAAFLMECAIDGYRPEDDMWRTDSVDALNQRTFEDNRTRPLDDILGDSRAALAKLIALIERLPEDKLTDEAHFDWLDGKTLAISIENETYGHIEEHWPDLQDWLARLPR